MYVYLNFKSENRSYPEVHSPTKIQAHIIGSFYKLQHPSIVSVSVGVSRHEQYLRWHIYAYTNASYVFNVYIISYGPIHK